MASTSQKPPTSRKLHPVSAALHTLERVLQPVAAFWTKFNNDWAWNNAAGLAYNLILAVFPIVITLLPILGFFLSTAPQKKGLEFMQQGKRGDSTWPSPWRQTVSTS